MSQISLRLLGPVEVLSWEALVPVKIKVYDAQQSSDLFEYKSERTHQPHCVLPAHLIKQI